MFLGKKTFLKSNITISEGIMARLIYADNAATTKLDIDAFEAMTPFLLQEYGNPSQPYSLSNKVNCALKEARACISDCINALPNEIYFTSGGTESDNWAIQGAVLANRERKTIVTSEIEHHAVLKSCEYMKNFGCDVVYVPVNSLGVVESKALSNVLAHDVNLVSIMLVNNEIGARQDIKKLAKIAHDSGALFHTDAVQAVGHIKVDVKDLGVDLMSASAHKFGGPKGIGFLYVKNGINIQPFMKGGAQEFNFRAGTENVPAIVGMATALHKSVLQRDSEYIHRMEKTIVHILKDNGLTEGMDFIINGNEESRVPGILSLSFAGKSGEMILHRMDLMGIMISTGAACDSVHTQISHVIRAIGVKENFAQGTIRISLGMNNTVNEAKQIGDALVKIIGKKGG